MVKPTRPFRFKQFTVKQADEVFKVGTDATLLGSVVALDWMRGLNRRVLDIGTGCGVIALMLAQRLEKSLDEEAFNSLTISGLDNHLESSSLAGLNFGRSPYSEQLISIAKPLDAFEAPPFDLVVSNPPYFSHSTAPKSAVNRRAKHTDDNLTLVELARHAARLTAESGRFACILPLAEMEQLQLYLAGYGLRPFAELRVFSTARKVPNRMIVEFARHIPNDNPHVENLTIRHDDGTFTEQYQRLMADFLTIF